MESRILALPASRSERADLLPAAKVEPFVQFYEISSCKTFSTLGIVRPGLDTHTIVPLYIPLYRYLW